MELAERVILLIIGAGIGYILHVIVSSLHDIKKELEKVVALEHRRDERGEFKMSFASIALVVVLVLTVWASFSSQKAVNDVHDTQADVTSNVQCNQEYLAKTITALNERTQYNLDQAKANVTLQKSQTVYYTALVDNPSDLEKQRLTKAYLNDLNEFVKVSAKRVDTIANNPFPTNKDFDKCLEEKKKEHQDD